MENEYPKWIALPESTPEEPRGIVVQNAEEENKYLAKPPAPQPLSDEELEKLTAPEGAVQGKKPKFLTQFLGN